MTETSKDFYRDMITENTQVLEKFLDIAYGSRKDESDDFKIDIPTHKMIVELYKKNKELLEIEHNCDPMYKFMVSENIMAMETYLEFADYDENEADSESNDNDQYMLHNDISVLEILNEVNLDNLDCLKNRPLF